jgi:poly(A) polymerase
MIYNEKNVPPAVVKKVISYDGPSPQELLHEPSLSAWCASRREPEEEHHRRVSVLSRLDNIVKLWVRSVMVTEFRMAPEAAARDVQPRLYTTGSFRYNVHSSGSDIDVVLIAPHRVTRQHFFTSLVERFRAESSWITSIDLVTDAIVPIIALKCDGIDIDLSFGAIRLSKVPEVITDDLLKGLDEQSVRSCNAVRVAHSVIELVPNTGPFRQALRFIKAWGKYRGIYSSKFGYPSGIGWALLVAYVAQCYPNQNASGLVCRFFRVYSKWFNPDPRLSGQPNTAIFLTESLTPATYVGPCWDPRAHAKDAQALFPVITPANPYANSCYNVTLTTLRILCSEFARGHEILSKRLSGPVPSSPAGDGSGSGGGGGGYGIWQELLEPYPFFLSHKHFLHVQVQAVPENYQRYVDAVEAKIRFLWAEHPMHRGKALECFPTVRVHVFSARFELPSEVARRSTAKGASSAPPTEVHTAHYFFGLDTVAAPAAAAPSGQQQQQQQQQKMDLAGVVAAFRAIVSEIKEHQPPATKLPTVAIVDASKVPDWILSLAGCSGGGLRKRPRDEEEELANAAATAHSSSAAQDGRAAPAQVAEVALAAPQQPPAPSPASAPPTARGADALRGVTAAPQPPAAAAMLDEALGMDF